MNNKCAEKNLVIAPSELQIDEIAKASYLYQNPESLLKDPNQAEIKTIIDTARVAFRHNKNQEGSVIVVSSKGEGQYQKIIDALVAEKIPASVNFQPDYNFTELSESAKREALCVDFRNNEAFEGNHGITRPGDVLKLGDSLKPDHITRSTQDALDYMHEQKAPITAMRHHVGIKNESPGCGKYEAMIAENVAFSDIISSTRDVVDFLLKLREANYKRLDPNCQLFVDIIDQTNQIIQSFDLDDGEDVNEIIGLNDRIAL